MRKDRSMTAFYIETVLMVIIFVLIILVMSRVLGLAKLQSADSRQMTNAVCLAQNAAEAVAASDSEEELLKLLNEDGNAQLTDEREGGQAILQAGYDQDMKPEKDGRMRLEVHWEPTKAETGAFVGSEIRVYAGDGEKPVYTLDTGVYLREQEGQ